MQQPHLSHFILARRTCIILFIFLNSLPSATIVAQSWSVKFEGIGSFSSPCITDLNGDGTGDIILGAGREEFKTCDSAVMALDGRTGALLWNVSASDQIFGSASLKDLNADGVQDAIIGGRSAELIAINGKTGKVFWRFNKTTGGKKWFGFYDSQFIPDQDNDGMEDILTSNGGDVMVEAYDPKRAVGHLVVISSRNGRLLAKAPMPDGKEIYMSVAKVPTANGKDYNVLFGTGGETIGGNLYVTTLSEILKGDLSKAVLLDTSPNKGYIGPPVWVDINQDSVPDIVANAVEGKLLAFDGSTYKPIWAVKIPDTEAYSSIAPGYFTGDSIPDFFVSYAVGVWPKLDWSRQFMVDGATGKIAFTDSLGYYQMSTPVAGDLNGDGWDEVLFSVNVQVYDEKDDRTFNNMLVIINFNGNEVAQLWESNIGSNLSSTPWIGDMNNDGIFDIVNCHHTNTKKTYTFDGFQVNRIDTGIPIKAPVNWGAYMGSVHDGVFRKK